ncbi:MAG: Na/Pi cotransporter family protein [Bacillota bacterium]|jgi:phosphate:Na+ symporter|nr:Na/Pi cotransporter family protein [Candidatus Fermentithermobacillaceae bacterium]
MQELLFGLIGGTALLMYGVDKMGEGLEKASGDMMRKILSVLTGRVWSAFLVGTFLTALVQSSTAITVLTVGFVNAGLMKLPQAVGIIYGANIGTTITAQLMAFSFHFKLTDIALPVIGLGFAISYFGQRKLKYVGDAVMGFGVMFLGLKILNAGIPLMQQSALLRQFFQQYASIPVVAIVLGAAATAMVHSSAATVGLVMILGQAGLLDLKSAVCIMLGDNIGTCITAQMASLTGNISARRTAWAHTLYNIIGVVLAAILLPFFLKSIVLFTDSFNPNGGIAAQIANSHTLFNVLSAVVFLPFTKQYVKFLEVLIRSKEGESEDTPVYLDRLLLDTPSAAIKAVASEMARVTDIARRMLDEVMNAFHENDEKLLDKARKDEDTLNTLQRQVTMYIVDLSKHELSDKQSRAVPAMISGINNAERIGDHALSIVSLAEMKIDGGLIFSREALQDLKRMHEVIGTMFNLTIESLQRTDGSHIKEVESLENTIDEMSREVQAGHARRLEEGRCTLEAGLIFLDVVNYLERIADHVLKACCSGQVIAEATHNTR